MSDALYTAFVEIRPDSTGFDQQVRDTITQATQTPAQIKLSLDDKEFVQQLRQLGSPNGSPLTAAERQLVLGVTYSATSVDEMRARIQALNLPAIAVPLTLDDEALRAQLLAVDRAISQRQQILRSAVAGKVDIGGVQLSHQDEEYLQGQIAQQVDDATKGAAPKITESGKRGGFLYGQSFGEAIRTAFATTLVYGGAFTIFSDLTKAITAGFSEAGLSDQAKQIINQTFGQAGVDAADSFASANAHRLGESTTASLQSQSTFDQLLKNLMPAGTTDAVIEQQAQKLDELTASLATSSHKNIDTVRNSVASFISGNKDALKDYGYTLTDAQQQQSALAHGVGQVQDRTQALKDAQDRVAHTQNALTDAQVAYNKVTQQGSETAAERNRLAQDVDLAERRRTSAIAAQTTALKDHGAASKQYYDATTQREEAEKRVAAALQAQADAQKPATADQQRDAKQRLTDAQNAYNDALAKEKDLQTSAPTVTLDQQAKGIADLYHALSNPPPKSKPDPVQELKANIADIEKGFATGLQPTLDRLAGWFDTHGDDIANVTKSISDAVATMLGYMGDHIGDVGALITLFTLIHEVRNDSSILNKLFGFLGVSNPYAKGGGGAASAASLTEQTTALTTNADTNTIKIVEAIKTSGGIGGGGGGGGGGKEPMPAPLPGPGGSGAPPEKPPWSSGPVPFPTPKNLIPGSALGGIAPGLALALAGQMDDITLQTGKGALGVGAIKFANATGDDRQQMLSDLEKDFAKSNLTVAEYLKQNVTDPILFVAGHEGYSQTQAQQLADALTNQLVGPLQSARPLPGVSKKDVDSVFGPMYAQIASAQPQRFVGFGGSIPGLEAFPVIQQNLADISSSLQHLAAQPPIQITINQQGVPAPHDTVLDVQRALSLAGVYNARRQIAPEVNRTPAGSGLRMTQ